MDEHQHQQQSPQYTFDFIFGKIFSNEQVARWLLSTDTEPPTVLTPDMMRFSITADSLFLGDKDKATYFFKKKDAEGNTETTAAENVVFVCHHFTDTHAYLTMTDSRTPFSFLEPPAAAVPGVRRAVAERSHNGLYLYLHYWLVDGRSNLGFLVYQFEPSMWSEKHILLLAQYPPSRYPQPRDVLEGLVMFEQSNCQYCLMRGYAQCECSNQIALRSKPVLPAIDQRNPWSLWAWAFGSYEAGLKKYFNNISSYTKNVQVALVGFNHITPTFFRTDQIEHVKGYQHYLDTVSPYFKSKIPTRTLNPGLLPENPPPTPLPQPLQQPQTAEAVAAEAGPSNDPSSMKRKRSSSLPDAKAKRSRVSGERPHDLSSHHTANLRTAVVSHSIPAQQTMEKVSSGAKAADEEGATLSDQEDEKLVLSLLEEVENARGPSGAREDCKICGASFARKYELKRHLKSSHLKLREFQCPHCDAKFKRKQHLDMHHQQIHEKDKNISFQCHYCDKSFTAESSRRRHIRTTHPFECDGPT